MTNDAHDETTTAGPAAAHPPFERLSDLADGGGALAGAERAAVERHVAACAACRAELDALRRVLALAHGAPRAVEPPPELWAGVRARLAPRSAVVGHLSWRRAPVLAAAAAVLAVASVGLLNWRARVAAEGARTAAVERLRDLATMPDPVARRALLDSLTAAGQLPVNGDPGLLARLAEGIAVALRPGGSCVPVVACERATAVADRQTAAFETATHELAVTVDARADRLPPAAREALTRNLGVVDTAIAEARAELDRDPADPAVADALAAAQERRLELLRQAARLLSED